MPTDSSDSPGDDDYRRKNRFIRFKDHVDNKIYRGYEIWSSLLWAWPPSPSPSPSSSQSCSPNEAHNSSSSSSLSSSSSSSPSSTISSAPSSTPKSSSLPVVSLDEVLATSSFPNPIYPRLPIDKDGHEGPGGVEEVYDWAVTSPYSPLNLQHLRQPVPRDIAQHDSPHIFQYSFSFSFPPWSSSSNSSPWSLPPPPPSSSPASYSSSPSSNPQFTFHDAFTDLLWYNMWNRLPELQDTHQRWGFSGSHPNRGLHVADWTAYLGYYGLWYVYFPRLFDRMHSTTWIHPDRLEDLLHQGPGHWIRVCETLRGDIENTASEPRLWFKRTREYGNGGGGGDAFRGWDKVWGWGQKREVFATATAAAAAAAAADIDEAFKTHDGKNLGLVSRSSLPSTPLPTSSPQPEVEEDLYNSLAASDFQVSGDKQPKGIALSSSSNNSRNNAATATTSEKAQADHEMPSFETTETTENSDGGKTVKTIRHDVDKTKGQIKIVTTTMTKRYDAEGSLVSDERYTTTKREWSFPADSPSSSFPLFRWGRISNGENDSDFGRDHFPYSIIPFDIWVASQGPRDQDLKAKPTGTSSMERTKAQKRQDERESEQKQREARVAYWASVDKIRQQEESNKKNGWFWTK